MLIAGTQKTTLIDYPGKIGATIFTQGCNFRCPFCHNPNLVSNPKKNQAFMEIDELLAFLEKREGLLDALIITGGEPLLQEDLQGFIRKVKKFKYLVKVDTNGFLSEVLEKLIKAELVDYWAMDVKGDEASYSKCAGVTVDFAKILKSIQLLKNCRVEYEFRSTVVPGLHDENVLENIGKLVKGARKFYLQNFRPDATLDPEFMKIAPFPPEKLLRFKSIMEGYVDEVELRGV